MRVDGYGKRYYYPQLATYENEYWDSTYKRTYNDLENYYKNLEYFNAKGYYSSYYDHTYYDGYGFNYYTGSYGYYEFSMPLVS